MYDENDFASASSESGVTDASDSTGAASVSDATDTTESLNPLALDNQLCFPLYAAAKELTRRYKPFLDPLGLTYTQYVAMMALWEQDSLTVSELGARLYLDSATLTPLLKRLEAHGYLNRTRSKKDERTVIITLTDDGRALHDLALDVPRCMAGCINMDPEKLLQLKGLLEELLASFAEA
ncbi:MAG: MarR family transcriptional regulator [Olsenella sp.]|nr:MarR family transcriptional regulator [Olsenella sp.]